MSEQLSLFTDDEQGARPSYQQRLELRRQELRATFLERARQAQGEGYQYRGYEEIENTTSHVDVHCPNPDHQWHPMRVDLILQGCKCRECAGRHQTVEERCQHFISRCLKKYGPNRYDYSRVHEDYKNNDSPVWIRCMIHDHWFQTTPDNNLRKVNGSCPICSQDFVESEGERAVRLWLEAHNIDHRTQEPIPNNDPSLPLQFLVADFWIYNNRGLPMIIEYNGEAHYEEVKHFFKDKPIRSFKVQQQRDRYLRRYCEDNGIWLLEIPYWDMNRIDEILSQTFL